MPHKTNSTVFLFLQLIIAYLKPGGRCAVVVPQGKELFSRSKQYKDIREYFLRTCNLCAVVLLESGVFDYTTIKTCVLIFEKADEGSSIDKNGFATRNVVFLKSNFQLVCELSMEQIAKNDCILEYTQYVFGEPAQQFYAFPQVELGDICKLERGKRLVVSDFCSGKYPVIGGGKQIGIHNEFNTEKMAILMSNCGNVGAVQRFDSEVWRTDVCLKISIKDKSRLIDDFIFYYLKLKHQEISRLGRGIAQPNLNPRDLAEFPVPLPPLEIQQQIAQKCNFLDATNQKCKALIAKLEIANKIIMERTSRVFAQEGQVVALGDICEIKRGKPLKKQDFVDGPYPVVGGGKQIGWHNEWNTEAGTVLCSASGCYAGKISKYDKQVWATSNCNVVKIKLQNAVGVDFLYYQLKYKEDCIYKLQKGLAQPQICAEYLREFKILLPPIEEQQKIAEFCTNQDRLIELNQQQQQLNDQLLRNIATMKGLF